MLNNPQDMLSILLRGVLGRSGRKRARRASGFLSGRGGFLTASTLMAAAGVAWGIWDSVKATGTTGATSATGTLGAFAASGALGVPAVPPIPVAGLPAMSDAAPTVASVASEALPAEVLRVIRLAVSAARADGDLSAPERALILQRAREAGVDAVVEAELAAARPLVEIVAGLVDDRQRQELYVLAFTIVRADETVSGAERVYLAQLAFRLGLDPATAARLESETVAAIDGQPE